MKNLSQFFSRIMNDLIKTQLRIFDVHCIFLSIIEIYTKQKEWLNFYNICQPTE